MPFAHHRPVKHERQSEEAFAEPAAKRQFIQAPTPPPSRAGTSNTAESSNTVGPAGRAVSASDMSGRAVPAEAGRFTAAQKQKQRAISASPPPFTSSSKGIPSSSLTIRIEAADFLRLAGIDLRASGLVKSDVPRFHALVKEFCRRENEKEGGQILTADKARMTYQIIVDVVKLGRLFRQ